MGQPRTDSEISSFSEMNAEERLWRALNRLIAGIPENKELVKTARLGAVPVNVSTVAREAKCSRTLIGYEGCKYQRIRDAIKEIQKNKNIFCNEKIVRDLIDSILDLEHKLALRISAYRELVTRTKAVSVKLVFDVKSYEYSSDGKSVIEKLDETAPARKKIDWLRKQVSLLSETIARSDTLYANLVLRARAYECKTEIYGLSSKNVSTLERRQALSIVGKHG